MLLTSTIACGIVVASTNIVGRAEQGHQSDQKGPQNHMCTGDYTTQGVAFASFIPFIPSFGPFGQVSLLTPKRTWVRFSSLSGGLECTQKYGSCCRSNKCFKDLTPFSEFENLLFVFLITKKNPDSENHNNTLATYITHGSATTPCEQVHRNAHRLE